ncbi:putative copia-type protein [Senna tora]|uniref:Putative copia-type protein n=1 Tax=Senna tora TaxID=362788 RepID=A0A834U0S6_9FABA|nr:putative copia-type protein [Senna tora]
MKEDVLTMINGDTAYETSIEEQLLPITIEKARWLKNMLMSIKKAAIKEPVSDQGKVFQFAHGLGPRYKILKKKKKETSSNMPKHFSGKEVEAEVEMVVTTEFISTHKEESEDFPQELAALTFHDTKDDQSFIVDSGATSHMINDACNLSYTKPYHGELKLKDVLVVHDLKKNLLSVGKFTSDHHCTFEFTSAGFIIKDQNQKMIARGHKQGQLYTLKEDCQEALRYSPIHKGYRYLDPRTKRVYISHHVVFDETTFPFMPSREVPSPPNLELTIFANYDEWSAPKHCTAQSPSPNKVAGSLEETPTRQSTISTQSIDHMSQNVAEQSSCCDQNCFTGPCVDLIQPQEEITNPLIEQPVGDALTEHESLPSEVVHQTSVESTSNAASLWLTRLCKPPSYLIDYVALATNSPHQCVEPKTVRTT